MATLADFTVLPPCPAVTTIEVPGLPTVHLAAPDFAALSATPTDPTHAAAHKIAMTVVDPSGSRLFTDADQVIAVLAGRAPQVLALLRAIQALFGW